MKVGGETGSSAKNKRAELPVLIVFILCCMVFSGVLSAQDATDSETSTQETIKTGVEETVKSVLSSEDVATSTDQADATTAESQAVVEDDTSRLEEILKKNNKCLRCHKKDKTKTLEDGEEMSIQVHIEDYLGSVHKEVSCISCHRAIGKRKHPSKKTNITINNQRDYAVEMNESCRKCHRQKYTQYKGSIHSALVSQGNADAPLCSDCHSAHSVQSQADYKPESGLPCKNCHENIFNAYSASVHGMARMEGNTIRDSHIQAPICADCHKSHEVTALAIGDVLRTTCINCHENVTLLHNQWLPNAGTHLDIVSCAVCHAPFARRKFDLHLYDNVAQGPFALPEGEEPIQVQLQAIADEEGVDDPLETWKARANLGQENQLVDISLRSRMEVMSGVSAHQIASKSFAVRTCESCHAQNSRQIKNVTLSFTQADGRTQSFEADRGVLGSVGAINSISDFYALGGNPNKLLDYLLILSLLAGFAIPIGHYMMGKFIKQIKETGEQ